MDFLKNYFNIPIYITKLEKSCLTVNDTIGILNKIKNLMTESYLIERFKES